MRMEKRAKVELFYQIPPNSTANTAIEGPLVYIALTLAAVLWFTYLLSGTPYTPPRPPVSI
jgi:hypothetical protein